ncbi:hypothetical protein CLTEP_03900 [Clostridium tepidiprofundi DSM 19306]|uniref:DUF1836 domain-containing protein n=1 Tax=Clostridium tepidiprofundi DSM 19306 TaxID=1121338 RepID=A0A151B7W7_9CLOT|nr:DUF1836 domain-containing protein [Clostridium tepidiprofundi]KYH35996.1 hypothetical protein CLTEP_03900 [Clostridium tepidiprofundi DSM 19306]
MEFSEKLNNIINDISFFDEIEISEIPCVDLYMDQVTTFFDDKLNHYKRNDKDKILTKTMINNYSKARILPPAKKKKYSKEHIILLILIYNLKQVLSINDIKTIMEPLLEKVSDESNSVSLENLYSIFLDIKEKEFKNFKESFQFQQNQIKYKLDELSEESKEMVQVILLIVTLINNACIQKRMAEKLIDNFFNKK